MVNGHQRSHCSFVDCIRWNFIGTLSERDQDTDLLIAYTSLLYVILFANGLLAIYATMNQGSVFVYEVQMQNPRITLQDILFQNMLSFFFRCWQHFHLAVFTQTMWW